MRSPKHLAVTLVVLTAVLVLCGVALPRLFGGSSGDNGGPSSAAHSPQDDTPVAHSRDLDGRSTGLPSRLREPLSTPESVKPAPRALTVASKWADAWVDHSAGMTKKEWLAALEPYTTREFLPRMKSIRLGNIPSSEVTGEPDAVSSHAKSVVVKLSTDGPDLRVTVIETDKGWRVARYQQAG